MFMFPGQEILTQEDTTCSYQQTPDLLSFSEEDENLCGTYGEMVNWAMFPVNLVLPFVRLRNLTLGKMLYIHSFVCIVKSYCVCVWPSGDRQYRQTGSSTPTASVLPPMLLLGVWHLISTGMKGWRQQ